MNRAKVKLSKQAPLKPKNGVFPNCIWLAQGSWDRILDYLVEKYPHISIEQWQARMARHEVVTGNGEVIHQASNYIGEQHLYFYRELDSELEIPFKEQLIFENDEFMVVDKPHFLPVAPTGKYLKETLVVRLRNTYKNDNIELCHRLDRETAGLVLISKKRANRPAYHQLFSQRKIKKIYWAIAPLSHRNFPLVRRSRIVAGEPYFRMKEVEGQPNSHTLVEKIESNTELSIYQLTPTTGKKHQLRLHLSALNIPIKNDHFYPNVTLKKQEDFKQPLQLLAKSLAFIDPVSGRSFFFESPQMLKLGLSV